MDSKTKKMMWRWSLVGAGLIALFWAAWYAVAGEVPTIDKAEFPKGHIIPLGMSRWWDVLIGPIFVVILLAFWKIVAITKRDKGNFSYGLFAGMTLGTILIMFTLRYPEITLTTVYTAGLALYSAFRIFSGAALPSSFILGSGLSVGLIMGLVFAIPLWLMIPLGWLITDEKTFWRWLNASDEQ